MKGLDFRHPFFAPLWRRVVTTGAVAAWAIFEFAMGNPLWALLFGAIAAWAGYQFFIDWRLPDDE